MVQETVEQLIEDWDNGKLIWSIEMGGLGPGYEQAIQFAAVEFSRVCKGFKTENDPEADWNRFREICHAKLHEFNEKLGGLTGAMFGAAVQLAWQWCVKRSPKQLIEWMEQEGQADRVIQVSKEF